MKQLAREQSTVTWRRQLANTSIGGIQVLLVGAWVQTWDMGLATPTGRAVVQQPGLHIKLSCQVYIAIL